MPLQRLSLFGPLNARSLEPFVLTIQSFSKNDLLQFKTLIKVYRDNAISSGGRPSDFVRLRLPWDSPTSDPIGTDDAHKEGLSDVHPPPVTKAGVLEVVDAPEVNKRPVTSRIVHVVPCTSGDPRRLVESMGYNLAYSYFEQGYELKIGSIVVRVHQIFKAEGTSADDEALQGVSIGDGTTWIVQADVDVRPGQADELKRGMDDLLRFKRDVQGYIDLSVLVDELR